MRRGWGPYLTEVATVALSMFGALVVARAAGVDVPERAMLGCAAATAAIALAIAGQAAVSAWRGPRIESFSRDHAVLCDPRDARCVRDAAQIRGTMGGAGYVHRRRRALPAAGWSAAAAGAAAQMLDPGLPPAVALAGIASLLVAAGLSRRFPPMPFYYLEAMDGWVLVHPQSAWTQLLARRGPPDAPRAVPSGGSWQGDEPPESLPAAPEPPKSNDVRARR